MLNAEKGAEEKLYEIAKRKGFFYQSSEIYGGLTGFYDYGSVGTSIKRNIENLWRKHYLGLGDSYCEIEPADVMHEKVFVASGHLKNFTDPSVRCTKCGAYHRADHVIGDAIGKSVEGSSSEEMTKMIKDSKIACPKCGGRLGEVKVLNMMFPTKLGAEEDTIAYLRPETAQGVYVNFLRQFNILRSRLPMGIAIVGKAFRNEISPRQLLIRQREFTQAELQIFFDPEKIDECKNWDEVKDYEIRVLGVGETKETMMRCDELASRKGIPKFYVYHLAKQQQFFVEIMEFPIEKFRMRELSKEERAFYNKIHFDAEVYLDGFGEFREVGGTHYRTDHDLKGHGEISGKSQEIFYNGKRFIPHVLELSVGIDRTFFAAMSLFYMGTKEREWEWFSFPEGIAPFTYAVFPLVNKDGISELAKKLYDGLKPKHTVTYDDSGSIGRRYARSDEIGIPFAITVDYQSLEDGTVTVRERDSTKQVRKHISAIGEQHAKNTSTKA